MSNACDPRNRPGFVEGDATAFLPEVTAAVSDAAEDMRLVVLAAMATVMIVAAVFGIVLFSA